MLQLEQVTVRFGDTVAVDDVSLDLPEGEVLAVLGPSGCGKSTLLRAIAGLEDLDAGRVLVDGVDQAGVPTHRRGFALMFQDGQLFRHLDVAANVGYPLRLRGTDRSVVATRVTELLETVGLAGFGARRTPTLSGGEQQRVALARALAAEPRMLLLDEPLSALDRSLRERLAADLRGILTRTGTTALLVTHDHDEAFTLADRMAVMFDGRIAQHGPTQQVWTAPADRQVAEFLGFGAFLEGAAAHRVATAGAAEGAEGGAAGDAAEGAEGGAAGVAAGDIAGAAGGIAGAAGGIAGPVRANAPYESAGASHGARLLAWREVAEGGRVLALRRSALRVDPAGSLSGTVVAAAGISDAVRVELDLQGVGLVEALAEQNAVLRPGDVVRVRADHAGMAVL